MHAASVTMSETKILKAIFVFLALYVVVCHGGKPGNTNHRQSRAAGQNDFDVLILAQTWPQTACYGWRRNLPQRQCTFPGSKKWLIHGLWPSKLNAAGPFDCDKSLAFDMHVLKPLTEELESKWMNMHKGEEHSAFWKHEWDKHGTCAVALQPLSSEYKYFKESLDLFDKYNMNRIFTQAKLMPGEKFKVQTILDGVAKILGKRVQLTCLNNPKTKEQYLAELRICFDKKLNLQDCDGIRSFPTNCSLQKEVIYPDSVPE